MRTWLALRQEYLPGGPLKSVSRLLITGLLPSEPEVFCWQQSSALGLQSPAQTIPNLRSLHVLVQACARRYARIYTPALLPQGGLLRHFFANTPVILRIPLEVQVRLESAAHLAQ